jgi:hypothetical protein
MKNKCQLISNLFAKLKFNFFHLSDACQRKSNIWWKLQKFWAKGECTQKLKGYLKVCGCDFTKFI